MAGGQRTRIANSCDRRVARGLSRALGSPLVGSSASRKGTGKNTLESRSGTEREIGGIRQLPLNVFNAAVEARKRSAEEKRSVALSLSLSLVGMEPCGPAVVVLPLLLLRVPLSTSVLSLYTYREVLPLPGRGQQCSRRPRERGEQAPPWIGLCQVGPKLCDRPAPGEGVKIHHRHLDWQPYRLTVERRHAKPLLPPRPI